VDPIKEPSLWYLVSKFFNNVIKGREESRALRGSILGMALGLVPLLTVIVVADGMIDGITARYRETLSYHLQAHPFGLSAPEDIGQIKATLAGIEGISGSFEERQGFGLAYAGSKRTGVTLRGLDDALLNDPGWKSYINFSSGGPNFHHDREVLLGEEVARKLGVSVGDDIKILTTRRAEGRSFLPKITTLQVGGIFSTGYQDLDRLWVLIPIEAAKRLLPEGDYFSIIGIKIEDLTQLTEKSWEIQEKILVGWRVKTWFEINRNQYQNYQTTRALLMIIMSMILLVSAVSISSSLLMTYLERRKELAILKSLGFSPSFIHRYFALLGFFSGLIGTTLGIFLGTLTAVNINGIIRGIESFLTWATSAIALLTGQPADPNFKLLSDAYYLETIPINLDLSTMFLVALLSLLFSVTASWIPALQASKLKPLSILRKI